MKNFIEEHQEQLCNIPRLYWSNLEKKLEIEIFDAGSYFSLSIDEENKYHAIVTAENGVEKDDPNSIFLIDHAWTYEAEHAEAILREFPSLLDRMANLMDIKQNQGTDHSDIVKKVLRKMWKFNDTYQMRKMGSAKGQTHDDKEYTPLWYILDEFGSRISHSSEPNVIFTNFFYVKKELMVTVMYLVKDLEYGDELLRDYVAKVHGDDNTKNARLLPWFPDKFNPASITDNWAEKLLVIKDETDRCKETLIRDEKPSIIKKPVKVYTTSHYVRDNLKSEDFVLINNESEADVLFLMEHFKNFEALGDRFVNQLPNEKVLTCKDLFAETAMRSVVYRYKDDLEAIPEDILENRGPLWIPTTFNLFNELPQFVKYFRNRAKNSDKDNTWIVKPWNLSRSLDHTVSNDLDQIIRLSATGPKIVCKYLDDPVVFYRKNIGWVKQDFRYCIYVKSVQPLEAYIHKVFWMRFGNKPFDLTDFYDFEKHYTHMWYRNCELFEVSYMEYIPLFNEMYPQLKFENIQEQINSCLKELLISATTEGQPHGLGQSNKCRAFYGIDLMLHWNDKEHTSARPVLLEANFNPDIERACRDVPGFVDEMFDLFFLNKVSSNFIKL